MVWPFSRRRVPNPYAEIHRLQGVVDRLGKQIVHSENLRMDLKRANESYVLRLERLASEAIGNGHRAAIAEARAAELQQVLDNLHAEVSRCTNEHLADIARIGELEGLLAEREMEIGEDEALIRNLEARLESAGLDPTTGSPRAKDEDDGA